MQSPRLVYIASPHLGQPRVETQKPGEAWVAGGMVSPNIPHPPAVLAQHHDPIAYRAIASPTAGPAQNEVSAIGPQVVQYVVPKNGPGKKGEDVGVQSSHLMQQPMMYAAPEPRAVYQPLPQIYRQAVPLAKQLPKPPHIPVVYRNQKVLEQPRPNLVRLVPVSSEVRPPVQLDNEVHQPVILRNSLPSNEAFQMQYVPAEGARIQQPLYLLPDGKLCEVVRTSPRHSQSVDQKAGKTGYVFCSLGPQNLKQGGQHVIQPQAPTVMSTLRTEALVPNQRLQPYRVVQYPVVKYVSGVSHLPVHSTSKPSVEEDKKTVSGAYTISEQRIELDDEELKQHKSVKQEILGTVLSCSAGAGEEGTLFPGRKSQGRNKSKVVRGGRNRIDSEKSIPDQTPPPPGKQTRQELVEKDEAKPCHHVATSVEVAVENVDERDVIETLRSLHEHHSQQQQEPRQNEEGFSDAMDSDNVSPKKHFLTKVRQITVEQAVHVQLPALSTAIPEKRLSSSPVESKRRKRRTSSLISKAPPRKCLKDDTSAETPAKEDEACIDACSNDEATAEPHKNPNAKILISEIGDQGKKVDCSMDLDLRASRSIKPSRLTAHLCL